MKEPLYIVDGVRTPFAKMGTTLAACDAAELGRTAAAAAGRCAPAAAAGRCAPAAAPPCVQHRAVHRVFRL